MQLLLISDTHGKLEVPYCEPDLVVLLGDIELDELKYIDEYFHCPKVGIPGNNNTEMDFDGLNIINLHKNETTVCGLKIAGFGGSPKYSERKGCYYSEEDVFNFIRELGQIDVFISHSNPRSEMNPTVHSGYRGFYSLDYFIRSGKTKYFFHGHTHKSYIEKRKDTIVKGVYMTELFAI